MAFWKKSEDPWDIDPDERRLASEPAEKAPGLLDTLRGDWDAMQVEWQEREYGITEKRRKIFGELQELWTGPTVKSRWNMELCQKTDFLF